MQVLFVSFARPMRQTIGPKTEKASGRKKRDRPEHPPTPSLHVAGFGPDTTRRDLITTFSPHCRIKSLVFMTGKGNKYYQHFAFVNTDSVAAAASALHALNGAALDGWVLKVNFAPVAPDDHSPRGRPCGGGRGWAPAGPPTDGSSWRSSRPRGQGPPPMH